MWWRFSACCISSVNNACTLIVKCPSLSDCHECSNYRRPWLCWNFEHHRILSGLPYPWHITFSGEFNYSSIHPYKHSVILTVLFVFVNIIVYQCSLECLFGIYVCVCHKPAFFILPLPARLSDGSVKHNAWENLSINTGWAFD